MKNTAAVRLLDHPNGPDTWSALMDALNPELEELERAGPRRASRSPPARTVGSSPAEAAAAVQAAAWAVVDDEDGVAMWHRPGGRLPGCRRSWRTWPARADSSR
jgi:hypothetical protein